MATSGLTKSIRLGNASDLVQLVRQVVDSYPPETQGEALRELIMSCTRKLVDVDGADQAAILYIGGLLTLTDQGVTGDLKLLLESSGEAKSLIEKLRGPLE
jgi:hypothetical protein